MGYTWESIRGDANAIAEKLKAIVHEGNVRRIVVKHDGRTVAEFPLTAGVVGAVIAPVLLLTVFFGSWAIGRRVADMNVMPRFNPDDEFAKNSKR